MDAWCLAALFALAAVLRLLIELCGKLEGQ